MIQREWQTVSVKSFTQTLDSYGQYRQNGSTSRNVEMVVKIASQALVDNPKYVDIDLVGITKDFQISDANQILIDGKLYNVKYVIPSGKYLQVLMKNE